MENNKSENQTQCSGFRCPNIIECDVREGIALCNECCKKLSENLIGCSLGMGKISIEDDNNE